MTAFEIRTLFPEPDFPASVLVYRGKEMVGSVVADMAAHGALMAMSQRANLCAEACDILAWIADDDGTLGASAFYEKHGVYPCDIPQRARALLGKINS